jgi:hypothetical protein
VVIIPTTLVETDFTTNTVLKREVRLQRILLVKKIYIFIIRKKGQEIFTNKFKFKEGALSIELLAGHLNRCLHRPTTQASIHESLKMT